MFRNTQLSFLSPWQGSTVTLPTLTLISYCLMITCLLLITFTVVLVPDKDALLLFQFLIGNCLTIPCLILIGFSEILASVTQIRSSTILIPSANVLKQTNFSSRFSLSLLFTRLIRCSTILIPSANVYGGSSLMLISSADAEKHAYFSCQSLIWMT